MNNDLWKDSIGTQWIHLFVEKEISRTCHKTQKCDIMKTIIHGTVQGKRKDPESTALSKWNKMTKPRNIQDMRGQQRVAKTHLKKAASAANIDNDDADRCQMTGFCYLV